ncbi:MAG: BMP family ABC transporter substrate-binding protein [Eubacterium sp.]|nr:BMP family ABC transporter substrate-binding protein [Eubacterium sp.]
MKKLLSLVVAVVLVASAFTMVGCGSSKDSGKSDDLKVGCIMVGDDQETYTKAHIDGIIEAAKEVGIPEKNLIWKYAVKEDDSCAKAAKELIGNGCSLIIANSYGHQDYIAKVAKENPKVNFVSMTGDFAAISGLDNLYNAFTNIYEARFVSGVVAGMKIKELADAKKIPEKAYTKDKKVKVGYVGAYPYAEVVSGYTAFFLGIKSVYKDVAMDVYYTNSWFDPKKEAAAADKFIKDNCIIVGQHADSTGAPSTVQKAKDNGTTVYSVGYNMDMLPVAKTAALTSPLNNWKVYYTDLFQAVVDGKDIPQDWAKGYADDAVSISKLGPEVAKGTDSKVEEVIKGIKDGSVKVFDTKNFTVKGKEVKSEKVDLSYMDFTANPPKVVYKGDKVEAIKTENGKTFFSESTLRSAPYFQLRIDGITELNPEQ